MYIGIDIGGTKTLVAILDDAGVIRESNKFPTPKDYPIFLRELAKSIASFTTKKFIACGVAVPGRIDREHGIDIADGNLPWHNVPIEDDIERMVHCPTITENDANLAGLSEAMLLKDEFSRVLYVTISTGIGTGFIVNQVIDAALANSEGGQLEIEYQGKVQPWEKFASGHAIVARYGKRAEDITDDESWRQIAKTIAIGLIDLIAMLQPEVIVLGGGVGGYYDRFSKFLVEDLKQYETPLVPIPPIRRAQRPEEAVVYGCYDLAKSTYAKDIR